MNRGREERIKENKSSQSYDIECVEVLDAMDVNNEYVDDDYIDYIDESIKTFRTSTKS